MNTFIINPRISSRYIIITLVAVFTSWVLHEFAHWLTGTVLGYDMGMSLNKAFPVNGHFNSDKDYMLVSGAGPLFTVLQAVLFFYLVQKRGSIILYPFLLVCFYMRLFASVISFRHLNDEARISKFLSLGTFTLPLIVTLLLFYMVCRTTWKQKISLRFNLLILGLIILFSSIIILADQFIHISIL